jgi:GNAT superfamily N-acetyltransferase
MIRKLEGADFQTIYGVINEAAIAYKNKIPADCYKTPYIPIEELNKEITLGVQFYGYSQIGQVIAVMGIQLVGDATLISHAYTLTSYQRMGIGEKLLNNLIPMAKTKRMLVGTWQDAVWAIAFYQKHDFELLSREETNKLLKKYWRISHRQLETSAVLELKRRP